MIFEYSGSENPLRRVFAPTLVLAGAHCSRTSFAIGAMQEYYAAASNDRLAKEAVNGGPIHSGANVRQGSRDRVEPGQPFQPEPVS